MAITAAFINRTMRHLRRKPGQISGGQAQRVGDRNGHRDQEEEAADENQRIH